MARTTGSDAAGSRASGRAGDRSTHRAASAYAGWQAWATRRASALLPAPIGPARVSRRPAPAAPGERSCAISSRSPSRPRSTVAGAGSRRPSIASCSARVRGSHSSSYRSSRRSSAAKRARASARRPSARHCSMAPRTASWLSGSAASAAAHRAAAPSPAADARRAARSSSATRPARSRSLPSATGCSPAWQRSAGMRGSNSPPYSASARSISPGVDAAAAAASNWSASSQSASGTPPRDGTRATGSACRARQAIPPTSRCARSDESAFSSARRRAGGSAAGASQAASASRPTLWVGSASSTARARIATPRPRSAATGAPAMATSILPSVVIRRAGIAGAGPLPRYPDMARPPSRQYSYRYGPWPFLPPAHLGQVGLPQLRYCSLMLIALPARAAPPAYSI